MYTIHIYLHCWRKKEIYIYAYYRYTLFIACTGIKQYNYLLVLIAIKMICTKRRLVTINYYTTYFTHEFCWFRSSMSLILRIGWQLAKWSSQNLYFKSLNLRSYNTYYPYVLHHTRTNSYIDKDDVIPKFIATVQQRATLQNYITHN